METALRRISLVRVRGHQPPRLAIKVGPLKPRMIASHDGAQTRMGTRTHADINAATTQKTTIASGGSRQRSSSRKPVNAMATSRPLPTALSQIGL